MGNVLRLVVGAGLVMSAACVDSKTTWIDIEGRVEVQGAVANPTVEFWTLNEDGTLGVLLESRDTSFYDRGDEGGFFYTNFIDTSPTGCMLLDATGGTYFNRVLGANVEVTGPQSLRAVFCDAEVGRIGLVDAIAITPLTTIAASRALELAAAGTDLQTAVDTSNRGVAQQYGLPSVVRILPVDAGDAAAIEIAPTAGRQYGLVLGGLAELAATLNVRPVELGRGLGLDSADGLLDGMTDGVVVTVGGNAGSVSLASTTGTADLQAGTDTFSASAYNATNLAGHVINGTPVPIGAASSGTLRIETTVLPAWISGGSGTAQLTSSRSGCTFTATGLPPGLSMSGDSITGTCPTLGPGTTMSISPPFTVTVTCANPTESHRVQFALTTIEPPPDFVPTDVKLVEGQLLTSPDPVIRCTGGTGPYRYAVDTGYALPWGVKLDRNTGQLTGTPNRRGTFDINLCCIDLVGSATCKQVEIVVAKAPSSGGGGGSYDGSYSANVTTVTPAGTTSGAGSFSCSGGSCQDPGGTFTGTVAGSGDFTGTTVVCQGCQPLAMSGRFSLTSSFTISGSDGSVSQTIVARKD